MSSPQRCLVDTPILVRLANSSDALHPVASHAIAELHLRGVELYVTPQNLIEFRSVATRPVSENGLGFHVKQVEEKTEEFEALFTLLSDAPAIFGEWKILVQRANVIGKQVHDARLVACCRVHQLDSVLTFNARHFVRFLPFLPDWTLIDPHTL